MRTIILCMIICLETTLGWFLVDHINNQDMIICGIMLGIERKEYERVIEIMDGYPSCDDTSYEEHDDTEFLLSDEYLLCSRDAGSTFGD